MRTNSSASFSSGAALRGFDGGGHTSASSDGENLYAAPVQMLDANQVMAQQLGDVATWRHELQVVNDLRGQQEQLDECKQVRHKSAIRSKSQRAGKVYLAEPDCFKATESV